MRRLVGTFSRVVVNCNTNKHCYDPLLGEVNWLGTDTQCSSNRLKRIMLHLCPPLRFTQARCTQETPREPVVKTDPQNRRGPTHPRAKSRAVPMCTYQDATGLNKKNCDRQRVEETPVHGCQLRAAAYTVGRGELKNLLSKHSLTAESASASATRGPPTGTSASTMVTTAA